jgi:hypothetical protein
LPYPWGDRVESAIGDFGLWVQITLTVLLLRALIGIFIVAFRSNHFYSRVVRPQRAEMLRTSSPLPPVSRPPPEAR